jgi:hypothetical protein
LISGSVAICDLVERELALGGLAGLSCAVGVKLAERGAHSIAPRDWKMLVSKAWTRVGAEP